MVINERILIEMVKDAMQKTAPKMYAELVAEGTLEEVAQMRAKAAMETYFDMRNTAMDISATSKKDYWERVQEHTMANRQAAEIAVTQATEFPIETQESDFNDDF